MRKELHGVVMKKKEMKRKGEVIYFAVLGTVYHPKENPDDYEIRILAKGKLKVLVGGRGIYFLNDELVEEIVDRKWREYLPKYKASERRGKRAKKDPVPHPIEIREHEIRKFFAEKGIELMEWEAEVGGLDLSDLINLG